jgi:extracellular elastinolytic metalloproteinase
VSTSSAFRAAEEQARSTGADIQLDPHVQHLLGDAYSVHGQQQHRGLSVYPHSIVFEVGADGEVRVDGDPLIDVDEIDVVPQIGVEAAVRAAVRHLRRGTEQRCHTAHEPIDRLRYRSRVLSAFPMPNRPTVLAAGPFDAPVQANLVLFRDGDQPQLAWLVSLVIKRIADFTLVVSATGKKPRVLDCAAEAASACIARVFPFHAGEPAIDSMFPRPATDYPPGIRPLEPFRDWVEKDQPFGNNVEMRIGVKKCVVPSTPGPIARRFLPAAGSVEEQAINAFFVCNFMHDFFSRIGFGEEDGNFQQQNFGGTGKAGDRLVVSIFTSAQGNANMRAQNDGGPAELSLGVWRNDTPPSIGRPVALDAGVVIHEYAHGVSQRLVSGRLKKTALSQPQGLALGEAWSDYFAVTILNFYRPPRSRRFTFAEFASGIQGGVRPHRYDQFPSDVRKLGTKGFDEQHTAGSIFAAALIRMHEELQALFADDANSATGQETAWRLVVDSMKVLKENPTFLHARDALISANTRLKLPQAATIETAIRRAFAQFGMGRKASCKNTSFKGFTPDFNA